MKKPSCSVLLLTLVTMTPARVEAQVSSDTLRGALLDLADRTPAPTVSREQVNGLATFIGNEVSTAPTGTSTGGLSFEFDTATGTFSRRTPTFGPSFADRSLTTGRRHVSFGFNWLLSRYDSLGGMDLDNGELLTARNAQAPLFPLSHATTYLDVSSDAVVAFATVGVTDDFDLGIIVPWVRVSVGAELRMFNGDVPLAVLTMPRMDASGIGDLGVYGKYRFWRDGAGGMAAQVELRLPTGDEDNLRGLGVTRTLLSLIWSDGIAGATNRRWAPHASIGYEFWSDDIDITRTLDVSARNQLRYAAGVELQAHPRLTVVADVLGRRVLKGGDPGTSDSRSNCPAEEVSKAWLDRPTG